MGSQAQPDNSADLTATLSAYAGRWYRAGHPLQPVGPLLDAQLALCVTLMQAFKWGQQIPRRLGQAASPRELATDKKAMRKLHHLYELRAWQWADLVLGASIDMEAKASREAQRLGAQIDIPLWVHNRLDSMEDWGSELATAALRSEDSRLANQVVARIESERAGLLRIRSLYDS